MRIILWNLFLLALPFLLYWGYLSLQAKKRADITGTLKDTPINLLFGIGLALAITSLVIFGLLSTKSVVNSTYQPTRVKDGNLVRV